MKLKVYTHGGPLTNLSDRQQERFIEELIKTKNQSVKFGLEKALIIMGYEVVEEN